MSRFGAERTRERVCHLRTPAQDTNPTTSPPRANGVSIRIPKSVRWDAPTYSSDRLKVVMKVPTWPRPEMNLFGNWICLLTVEALTLK